MGGPGKQLLSLEEEVIRLRWKENFLKKAAGSREAVRGEKKRKGFAVIRKMSISFPLGLNRTGAGSSFRGEVRWTRQPGVHPRVVA
ncbi:hypothetical protein GCM10011571_14360 [Marinithermofilum abyssi]|uniref:Uncharacterized protein n=1 Tax=Marinithermofilum abyssi TaxID=1571185 RepID=A0A8J2VBV1_9BACL|nr:hypothetical protein GCM10011571_14360 [Marinithermofilum abyssi]